MLQTVHLRYTCSSPLLLHHLLCSFPWPVVYRCSGDTKKGLLYLYMNATSAAHTALRLTLAYYVNCPPCWKYWANRNVYLLLFQSELPITAMDLHIPSRTRPLLQVPHHKLLRILLMHSSSSSSSIIIN